MSKVLLTGITGFLGSHTAIRLLNAGHEVVGTLRDKARSDQIRGVLAQHTPNIDSLSLAEADLMDGDAWGGLMEGVDFVQHIASPFPRGVPRNDDELVIPARDGALAVLKAATAHGVKRVVLVSSIAAIIYGQDKRDRTGTYTESDWTNTENRSDSTAYARSKTIAENAAWKFVETEAAAPELVAICPGAILGPVLEKDFGTSANMVIKMMNGDFPGIPNLGFNIVDVRSVADLLVLAMERAEAANERFIASAGYLSLGEVAAILRSEHSGAKIPTRSLPNLMVRLFANFDKSIQPVLPELGVERKVDGAKAKTRLGWEPLPNREAVLSCAESVTRLGLV